MLIGLWTEDLIVQADHFLIAVTRTVRDQIASQLLQPSAPVSLAEHAVGFQIQYIQIKETNQAYMALQVDTLNGLRYIRQFLPEDSVLRKLPR